MDRLASALAGARSILFGGEAELRFALTAVPLVYLATYVLSSLLPASALTPGYVVTPTPDGVGYRSLYRLNGLRVMAAVCLVGLPWAKAPATAFADSFPQGALVACGIGLLLSAAYFVRGRGLLETNELDRRARCPTVEWTPTAKKAEEAAAPAAAADAISSTTTSTTTTPSRRKRSNSVAAPAPAAAPSRTPSPRPDTSEFDARSSLEHFWCGLSEFNPAGPSLPLPFALPVDVKMWLYVVGAVMLQVNLISLLAAHIRGRAEAGAAPDSGLAVPALLGGGTVSHAAAAYFGCLTFFLVEYLFNEEVHLYTYDIFRERIGLKLLWGCTCFYPFFYAIGGLPLAFDAGAGDVPPSTAALIALLFFAGWTLTRGANMQKFACKQGRMEFCFGLVPMETVPGSRGRLLCSGFWALSRHVNYAGEILQAVALALPGYLVTGSLLPWLYPLYYVSLFLPRQADDDAMCAARYGAVWGEYVKRVPYRIFPWVY